MPITLTNNRLRPILQTTPSRMPITKPSETKPQPVTIAWNAPTKAEAKKCTTIMRRYTLPISMTATSVVKMRYTSCGKNSSTTTMMQAKPRPSDRVAQQTFPARSFLLAPRFCPIMAADAVSTPLLNTSENF